MATDEQDVKLAERLPARLYSLNEVRELVLQGAGLGTAAIMNKPGLAGDVVMPIKELIEGVDRILTDYHDRNPSASDLCEAAWGIIANAYGGNWEDASDEWREAAERWREQWHRLLDRELHGA